MHVIVFLSGPVHKWVGQKLW